MKKEKNLKKRWFSPGPRQCHKFAPIAPNCTRDEHGFITDLDNNGCIYPNLIGYGNPSRGIIKPTANCRMIINSICCTVGFVPHHCKCQENNIWITGTMPGIEDAPSNCIWTNKNPNNPKCLFILNDFE